MLNKDLFEHLAIERRRRNELERKQRIFDPKMRIKGVDFAAIPNQIKEKEERKLVEKEREYMFAQSCQDINALLEKIDQDFHKRRINEGYKLNEFRKHQHREDPLIPRVPIDKEIPHVSNCQTFVGDDLDKEERSKKQNEQMKVWVMEQVWQREENKKKEHEVEKQYKQYQDQLIQSLEEIEKSRNELTKERNRRDAEFNLKLSAYKKMDDLKDSEERTFGHIELMNHSKLGDLIYENTNPLRLDGKVNVSEYKGMSHQQIHDIRRTQIDQVALKIHQKKQYIEEEKDYAEYQKQVIQMQDLLDSKKSEIQKEQVRLQDQVNELLREQAKRRNQKVIESGQQPFFSTFNQSSR